MREAVNPFPNRIMLWRFNQAQTNFLSPLIQLLEDITEGLKESGIEMSLLFVFVLD
jgi:hypothetical protein